MSIRTLAALLLALPLTLATAQEMDNPEYKMWSGFKPGSSATYETETVTGGNTMKIVETITVKSVDAGKVVIETSRTMHVAGQKIDQPAQPREIPAKVTAQGQPAEGTATQPKAETTQGKETLKIAGAELACDWTNIKMAQPAMTVKTWTCTKVPGHQVKLISESAQSKTTRTLVKFDVK